MLNMVKEDMQSVGVAEEDSRDETEDKIEEWGEDWVVHLMDKLPSTTHITSCWKAKRAYGDVSFFTGDCLFHWTSHLDIKSHIPAVSLMVGVLCYFSFCYFYNLWCSGIAVWNTFILINFSNNLKSKVSNYNSVLKVQNIFWLHSSYMRSKQEFVETFLKNLTSWFRLFDQRL